MSDDSMSQQPDHRSLLRRNRTRALIVLAAAAAAAALVYVVARDDEKPAAAPPPGTTTSTATTTNAPPKVDLAQPWRNTPVADWPDGPAGLVLPAGAAMNGFTAAQVNAALAAAKDGVVALRVDRRVVQDGDVAAMQSRFAPDIRQEMLEQPTLRTRLAPGFTLLAVPPKTKGRFTVEPGEKGELVIVADYIVAYAFHTDEPDKVTRPMDIVSMVRVDNERFVYRDISRFDAGSAGLWPGRSTWHLFSINCELSTDGQLAPVYSGNSRGPDGVEEGKLMNLDEPLQDTDSC